MIFENLFKKQYPGAIAHINHPISHKAHKGKKLFEEGYNYNVVVYRCVDSIIKALKGVDIQIKRGDEIIGEHDVLTLLKKPNPNQKKGAFLTEAFINRLVLGEMFTVTAEDVDAVPRELWNLNPLEMHIKAGKGMPRGYIQKVNGNEKEWPVDQLTGASQVFYWKGHNPLDRWRGMSPLNAACLAADTNNAGLRWNFSMLKKGGRLSGVVSYKGNGPDEQGMKRLKQWFKSTLQGEYNAGEVGILTGEAEFKEMGKSPKDMDYIKTVDKTTAFIAMAYGVPLPLVLNEAATFNNYREAKEQFYTDTVLPLFGEFLEEFGGWLLPRFGLDDAQFFYDRDSIPALETVRERRDERMIKRVDSGIISRDEARIELGYNPRGGMADELFISATNIPLDDSGVDIPDDEKSGNLRELLLKSGYSDDEIKEALSAEG